MTIRRSMICLCMLCALAVSAFAAQSAAASKGTTAFTCKKTGPGGGFTGAHCKPSDAGSGEYSHVAIAEGTTTELEGTNKNTASGTTAATPIKLRNTVSGIEYELQATGIKGTGSVTNAKDPETGEHYVHGSAIVTFTELTVTKPAGKGCKVKNGEIVSKEMVASTKGQGDNLNFSPKEGTAMAVYEIEGCTVGGINGTWEIAGSIKCPVDGATVLCTHAETTAQGTLSDKGSKCGIEGAMTISAKDPKIAEDTYRPLSVTTVET